MNDGRRGGVVLCHYECWLELLVFDHISIKRMDMYNRKINTRMCSEALVLSSRPLQRLTRPTYAFSSRVLEVTYLAQ
jgi:hypothetical protein